MISTISQVFDELNEHSDDDESSTDMPPQPASYHEFSLPDHDFVGEKRTDEIDEKEEKIQQLEQDLKKSSLLGWRTMNEKLKQDVEMEVWRRKFKVLQDEQNEREKQLAQKSKEIETLKNEVQAKVEDNYKLGLKLLDFQSKMSSVELQLRKFPVRKIYKFYANVDVEIVLTKNPSNGLLGLDVVEKGKHFLRPLKSVASLSLASDNRFIIAYTDGPTETFESEVSKDIVQSIQELLTEQLS